MRSRREGLQKLAGETGHMVVDLRLAGFYVEAAMMEGLASVAREYAEHLFRTGVEPDEAAEDEPALAAKPAGKRGPDTKPRKPRKPRGEQTSIPGSTPPGPGGCTKSTECEKLDRHPGECGPAEGGAK